MADDRNSEYHPDAAGIGPPSTWTMAALVVMSVITILFSGYMIYTYSGSRTETASVKPPAQTGFKPVVDEVRPVPGTVGRGGERE